MVKSSIKANLPPKIEKILIGMSVEHLIESAQTSDTPEIFLNQGDTQAHWEEFVHVVYDEQGDRHFSEYKTNLGNKKNLMAALVLDNLDEIKRNAISRLESMGYDFNDPDEFLLSVKVGSAAREVAFRGRPYEGGPKPKSGKGRGRPPGTGHIQRGIESPPDAPKIGRAALTQEQREEAARKARENIRSGKSLAEKFNQPKEPKDTRTVGQILDDAFGGF